MSPYSLFYNQIIKVYRYFKNHEFLEALFFNIMIFSNLFYNEYGYKFGLVLFFLVLLLKIAKGRVENSVFTTKLFTHSPINYAYQLFGMVNVMLFISLFIIIDWESVYFLMMMILYRVILFAENNYVQKKILSHSIEDLYLFEKEIEIPQLSNSSTVQSVMRLYTIRDKIRQSINKELEADFLKTELITNISHDLKTPLTSIINYSDLLSKKDKMDTDAKDYINVLSRNSQRLIALINDLIYASKTGSGNINVEKNTIEFNELVLQIYGDFDELFKSRDLEFVYEYKESEIFLYTDGNIMSRIIQNLISNAYKYSLQGTTIYSKVSVEKDNIIFIMQNYMKEDFQMNPERLTAELVKIEKSRSTEGSGLGLYITNNLVEILGGKFEVDIKDEIFKVKFQLKR